LHANDWQTALQPVFLKEFYGNSRWPLGKRSATVFTTHNLEYQGLFPGTWAASVNDTHVDYLFRQGVLGLHRWYGDSERNAYHIDESHINI
jgi:glycogen synthase